MSVRERIEFAASFFLFGLAIGMIIVVAHYTLQGCK